MYVLEPVGYDNEGLDVTDMWTEHGITDFHDFLPGYHNFIFETPEGALNWLLEKHNGPDQFGIAGIFQVVEFTPSVHSNSV